MNQKQLENRKQNVSLSVTSIQKIQVLKQKKNSEKKGIKKKNVVDTQCKRNIDTAAEEHSSPGNT